MKQNSKLASAGALEMYALGCIDKEDLEYVLQKSFKSLTQEELKYINDVKRSLDRYKLKRASYHNPIDCAFALCAGVEVGLDREEENLNITINIYNQYFK